MSMCVHAYCVCEHACVRACVCACVRAGVCAFLQQLSIFCLLPISMICSGVCFYMLLMGSPPYQPDTTGGMAGLTLLYVNMLDGCILNRIRDNISASKCSSHSRSCGGNLPRC